MTIQSGWSTIVDVYNNKQQELQLTMPNVNYFNQLESLAWSKNFEDREAGTGFLFKETVQDFFNDFVNELSDDPDYFVNNFQNIFEVSLKDYSVSELIDASPLTMQNSLTPSRIEAIWKHSNTGLASIGQLLKHIVVAVKPDGSLMVVGGNHRLAAIALPFVLSDGLDKEEISSTFLNTNVRCLQYQIDYEELARDLQGNDENGEIIEPTEQEIVDAANKLIVKLWEADNQSRQMKPAEIAGAKLYEYGIDRTNNDELLDALFNHKPGTAKLLNDTEGFVYIARNLFDANDSLDYVTDGDGNRVYDPNICARAVYIPAIDDQYAVSLTRVSFDTIIKSFYTALKSDAVVTITSKGTERAVKLWTKDVKDQDCFVKIVKDAVESGSGESPLIAQAIDSYVNSLPEDSEYRNNVAKNATKIGKHMFDMYKQAGAKPQYDVFEKADRTSAPRRVKRTLGLGL